MIARLLGVIQLVVGAVIWIRGGAGLVAFHAATGSLFVLALWIIGAIALFALPRRSLPLFALFWGAVVLWFGMAQTTLLVGSAHWAIRVAHLLVGIAAMGVAEALAGATERHWAAAHNG